MFQFSLVQINIHFIITAKRKKTVPVGISSQKAVEKKEMIVIGKKDIKNDGA